MRTRYLTVRQSVDSFIDAQQLPLHLSCDWIRNVTALGLLIFPLFVYRKMEELQNGNGNG